MKKQSGFTLIELAIVLVIIGLLLGGVLKGQELITQAKIKNVANDFNGITAAIYSYRDRYNMLPGDDKNAATRWTNPAATSGNGDGAVTGGYESGTATDESRLFWQDLRLSGFTSGAGADTNQPLNASGGKVGVQNGGLGLSGLVICSANLPAKIASAIDSQMDDGDATTGTLRGLLQTGSNDAVPAALPGTAATYVDNGANLYVICKNI